MGREIGERCGRRLRELERGAVTVSIAMGQVTVLSILKRRGSCDQRVSSGGERRTRRR